MYYWHTDPAGAFADLDATTAPVPDGYTLAPDPAGRAQVAGILQDAEGNDLGAIAYPVP